MPHEVLFGYLSRVERAIAQLSNAYVERYIEELLSEERANLRIRIRFDSGKLLEINEAIVVNNNQLTSLDYRYHCQDAQNQLVFRYDSTPHFPDLPTFPHHKHRPNDVVASPKPDLEQVLQEAAAR